MTYLLYMKRSFTRSPRRHTVLFAVLTCAFLLPLLISIYRDSNAWGTRQYLLARSAGETYHIGNATEVDVPYFEGIRGLSAPVYRDGTIYLHILSDEEWRNAESVTVFENEIRKRMEVSGNEALLPTAFSYEYAHGISTDPSHLSGQRSLLLVNMLVILLSVSVVRSAYRSHLKRFTSDIGTLRACGASRRQISVLFAAELAAVFLLAVFVYYIYRTGNSATTSSAELAFRNFLENTLVIRPRTKEMIVGWPMLMLFIWSLRRRMKFLPMIFGTGMTIGLVSVVNTFLHIRTPFLLSLLRTGWGILFGLLIGTAVVIVAELIYRLVRRICGVTNG